MSTEGEEIYASLRALYPSLGDEEIVEADRRMKGYLAIVYRVFCRIHPNFDPENVLLKMYQPSSLTEKDQVPYDSHRTVASSLSTKTHQ